MDGQLALPSPPAGLSGLWKKKEGKPIVIVSAAAILSFLYWGMPALIEFATDLLHLGIIAAGALMVWWVIVDNELRTKVWYMYKALILAAFGWFVDMNPVSILKDHIVFLQKQLASFKQQVTELRGHSRALENEIAKSTAERDEAKNLAVKMDKTDRMRALAYAARVPKIEEGMARNMKLKQKIDMLINIFSRVQKANEIVIENTQFDVDRMIRERTIGGVAVKAIKNSFAILFGNSADRDIYEQAVGKMQNDIAMQQGIFDGFMEESKPVLEKIDLQNGIFEDQGMKLLEAWDEKMPALLGINQSQMVVSTQVPVDAKFEDLPNSDYASLVK